MESHGLLGDGLVGHVGHVVLEGLPVLAIKLSPLLAVPLGVVALVRGLSDLLAVRRVLAVGSH